MKESSTRPHRPGGFLYLDSGAYYIELQPINLYPLSQKGQRVGFIRLLIS